MFKLRNFPAFIGLFLFLTANASAVTFTSSIQQGNIKKNAILTENFQIEFSDLIKEQTDSDSDGISDIVEIIAEAAENSWSVQVTEMGYDAPVGSGSHLSIILDDTDDYLTEGAVGITSIESDGVSPYLAIDPWQSENILNVTIAHEFFHCIQFTYSEDGSDFAGTFQGVALAEEIAVWFEDRVYDSVNDYLGYLGGFLDYPDFSVFSGVSPASNPYYVYGLTIWPKFLGQYFHSDALIKDILDTYFSSSLSYENEYKVYDAFKDTINSNGDDIDNTFQEFTLWNLDLNQYEEGVNYPEVFTITDTTQDAYTLSAESTAPALYGTNYLYFENTDGDDDFHFHIQKADGVSFALALVGKKKSGPDLNNVEKLIIAEDSSMESELVLNGLSNYEGVYAVISPLQSEFNDSESDIGVFDEGYRYYYIAGFGHSVISTQDLSVTSSSEKDGVSTISTDSRSSDSLVLQIIDYDEESVSLKWNRLTDPSISSYLIKYGTSSTSYSENQEVTKAYITNGTVHGLTEGETYYFEIHALDSDGNDVLESQQIVVTPKQWVFTDVSYLHSNYDSISSLVDWGIFEGYSDGSFKPDWKINRAELLKIFITGQGIEPAADLYNNCFTDVKSEWYAKYVCYAKSKDWIAGYADGSFKPSNYANKAEALKMLLNTYGEKLTEGIKINSIPYDDVVKSAWYAIYVWKASKLSILEENSGDNFYPSNIRTRAEMAEELYRYLVVKGLKHI